MSRQHWAGKLGGGHKEHHNVAQQLLCDLHG
jgi:hypothetical protein